MQRTVRSLFLQRRPRSAGPAGVSTADALEIIKQLAEAGVRVLAFSGGEPLLRADLPALIRYAAQRGLTTNVAPTARWWTTAWHCGSRRPA